MLPTLQIGSLAIPTAAFILLIGLWIGLSVAERRSDKHQIDKEVLFNLATLALVTGLVAARLGYVARYPSAFMKNPVDIISRNTGLFDPITGIFFGSLTALIYIQRRNLAILAMMDALTPALAILGIALGFAHLASGDAYGSPTTLPWGVFMWGATRHPSQVYEIFAAIIILILILSSKTFPPRQRKGTIFISYLTMAAFARLILEAFRGDSQLFIFGIRSMQILSWLILALCFLALSKLRIKLEEVR